MTFTAIRPDLGLSNAREVSLFSVVIRDVPILEGVSDAEEHGQLWTLLTQHHAFGDTQKALENDDQLPRRAELRELRRGNPSDRLEGSARWRRQRHVET